MNTIDLPIEPIQFYTQTKSDNVTLTLLLFLIVLLFPMTYKLVSKLVQTMELLKIQCASNKITCSKLMSILEELDDEESDDVKMIEPVFLVNKCDDAAIMPKRANANDAGYDLFAIDDVKIDAHGQDLIGTGLCVAIPKGYYGQIQPRSSLAVKYRVTPEGGVIDSGYRGEVKVILHNMSDNVFEIKKGNKIAQLILIKIITPDIMEVSELTTTVRGTGGFGSTGR